MELSPDYTKLLKRGPRMRTGCRPPVDALIDYLAFRRLLGLRVYRIDPEWGYRRLADDPFAGVPAEALTEFPPHWIAHVRGWKGQAICPPEAYVGQN